jgi:hypothetical protein
MIGWDSVGPVLRQDLEKAMDDLTFDRLARLVSTDTSRRKIVKTASASALGALGLAALLGVDETRAKKGGKKKKSRRCKKNVGATCNPPGKKCCRGLACEEGSCCKKLGTKCDALAEVTECCPDFICDNVQGGNPEDERCCSIEGGHCSKERDCCDGFTCNEDTNECEPEE